MLRYSMYVCVDVFMVLKHAPRVHRKREVYVAKLSHEANMYVM